MSSWSTPTYRHRWGQYVRHTLIYSRATFDDGAGFTQALDTAEVPVGIYAGYVWGRSEGAVGSHTNTVTITSGQTTVGAPASNENLIYNNQVTVATDPDGFAARSIFENVAAPSVANYIGDVTLPTNELRLYGISSNAGETTTLDIYIALFSHRLEV